MLIFVLGGGDCGGYSSCDCNYHKGGCSISKSAPVNTACKCIYKGGWTCGGMVAHCLIPTADRCTSPDKSIQSCTLGGGDCKGYKTTCDCKYARGGCYISKAPPATTACKCRYKGGWTCGGSVIPCRHYTSPDCIRPNKSKSTCLLGGGDCGGYNTRRRRRRRRRRGWGKK